MTARKPIRRRRKPPTESDMTILLPVEGEVTSMGRQPVHFTAMSGMMADDGALLLDLLAGERVKLKLRISGIELHTALHALGFVRLNDRDGYG